IHAASPHNEVFIFEKTPKLLSKVKISGGGRCNVTHRPMEIAKLVKNYPRGEKFLKKVFRHFKQEDTFQWFESRGVQLKIESDGRVFPVSDQSSSIIEALLKEAKAKNIRIETGMNLKRMEANGNTWTLHFDSGSRQFDKVVICSGGHPKTEGYQFLKGLKHTIASPIPSLFTFNTPQESIRELMGLSLPNAYVRLEGTKLSYQGPVLITHWGVSGPAVLKLSAFGAAWLHEKEYQAKAIINWNQDFGEEDYQNQIRNYIQAHSSRKVKNYPLFDIPGRLWEHILEKSLIEEEQIYGNLGKKQINKLVQHLFCYILSVKGKTTFKEEFVTAGGVQLNEVDPETMASKFHPNLYFAGEVLNVDGITGGFNFQAAWSTGFLAGKTIINSAI
ncbi:MAG TPA: aminoacetone oxidase family FAD-binding enzyme, partial [Algoriphagus sp.]|nr:aminoacetone oxidase family FAD-binding enzyme [Algoriphagus sp.]